MRPEEGEPVGPRGASGREHGAIIERPFLNDGIVELVGGGLRFS